MVAVGWIRTNDLLVMSQASYQLLHPAWLRKTDSNRRFSPYEGDEIGLFSTRLKTTDNRKIYIPNNTISTSIIDNFSQADRRRVEWSLSVSYGDDVEKLRTAILAMFEGDSRVLTEPAAPVVYLSQLADSAVVLSVRVWCNTADYWNLYFEYNERMYNELPKCGANFPFPQLDVHITNK